VRLQIVDTRLLALHDLNVQKTPFGQCRMQLYEEKIRHLATEQQQSLFTNILLCFSGYVFENVNKFL